MCPLTSCEYMDQRIKSFIMNLLFHREFNFSSHRHCIRRVFVIESNMLKGQISVWERTVMTTPIRILITCCAAILAGILLGNSAVYVFNRIPGKWLTDYGEEPSEELLRPTAQRIKSVPWKYAFTGIFTAVGIYMGVLDPSKLIFFHNHIPFLFRFLLHFQIHLQILNILF